MISERHAKSILTQQGYGFLASGPYPFTHSLSPYTGCGFGQNYCGQYCYAASTPQWLAHSQAGDAWGEAVDVKVNAGDLLAKELNKAGKKRRAWRIFMSSVTDPYQPVEKKYQITRQLLQAFAQYDDLDLLVVQTRGLLASRDFDCLIKIPYAYLSVTIEGDSPDYFNGPTLNWLHGRLDLVQEAVRLGIPTQIVISPCLPYTDQFARKLVNTGVRRIVVDNFVEGDGSGGKRTATSPFGQTATWDWQSTQPAKQLFEQLRQLHPTLTPGWSVAGFCGIPNRSQR